MKQIEKMKEEEKEVLLKEENICKEFYYIANNPDALTNELVKLIGQAYLNKYPIKEGYFANFFHSNQSVALQLKRCDQSDAFDRWKFLINIYAQLPNTSGHLSGTIVFLFINAFNRGPNFLNYAIYPPAILSTKAVSIQLDNILNKHYCETYRHNIRACESI